jgi:hypothetical protein
MVELLLKHHADPNGFVNASGNAVYAAKTPEIRKLLEAHGGFLDPYDLVWKGVRRFCWSSAPIRHRRTRTARRP